MAQFGGEEDVVAGEGGVRKVAAEHGAHGAFGRVCMSTIKVPNAGVKRYFSAAVGLLG